MPLTQRCLLNNAAPAACPTVFVVIPPAAARGRALFELAAQPHDPLPLAPPAYAPPPSQSGDTQTVNSQQTKQQSITTCNTIQTNTSKHTNTDTVNEINLTICILTIIKD